MNTPGRYVQRATLPSAVIACRYTPGQPLDELRVLAEFDTPAAELTEIPEWRCLAVRLGNPEDPDYEVVEDGGWLVYNQRTRHVRAWTDEAFRDHHFKPQPGVLAAVASVIGRHMILRESPEQIAAAALAAAGEHRAQESTARPAVRP